MDKPDSPKPEVPAVASRPCPHCGSEDVVTGLKVNQNAEVGNIGLAYKTARIFVGTEQLHADLCRACGSVVRFFVKDPRRNWVR